MNISRLALLVTLTLALAACGDDKNNPNYGSFGNDGSALPGGNNNGDQVNGNNNGDGIPRPVLRMA
jgi:hypothetical protein